MAKNKKIMILKGLPASGKSTYAKKMIEQGWIRVNKDLIREQLFGSNWKPKNEKQVIRIRDLIIKDCLENNKNVIVDDTNLNPAHETMLRSIAKSFNAEFSINDSFMKVPIEICIERDLQRDKSVGEKVIRQMYNKYIKPRIKSPAYDETLPYAVIFDIDGTLAHMKNRSPYEWTKVGTDDVDSSIAFVADALYETGRTKVFIFSGRDEICRAETEDWLDRNDIEYDALYMRPSNRLDAKGNQVNDRIIKQEMYEQYIEGKYNLIGIFDDRPSVCNMWRDLGLKVMQVGDPYDDF